MYVDSNKENSALASKRRKNGYIGYFFRRN